MSWQIASFVVLGMVLIGGFAWYERTRPPSQIVALVAALAALAVAGRLVLAPVPNVVATTDIVIFSGYALGAAPGFVVGALAGLISNFWLGQGPWTPWQMAGWGLAGVLGAVLALAMRRRAGRLELTVACGFAGIAYGALLNFSLMVSYGGEFTLDRWLTLEARAVPFDLAHAIGNITLALIAGPAMVRMLMRFRERFEFRWRREAAAEPGGTGLAGAATALLLAVLTVSLFLPAPATAKPPAAAWLQRVENPDGGFPATPGGESSTEITAWAMLGLEAAGVNPLDVGRRGHSPVHYLRRNVSDLRTPGDLARTILALRGAGVDVRHFAGQNLAARLAGRRRGNGSYQGWPNSTAFAVMALRASGMGARIGRSLAWLRQVQNPDGGWGAVPGSPSDADSAGAVLQALGPGSAAARRAVRYLRRSQKRSGGWALGVSGTVNSQSTAWAVQGLLAAGVRPSSVRRGGRTGLDYLAACRASDGHYRYSSSSDQTPVWVTGQVLVAAKLKPFPLAPVPRASGAAGRTGDAGGVGSVAAEGGDVSGEGAAAPLPNGVNASEQRGRSDHDPAGRASRERGRGAPPPATLPGDPENARAAIDAADASQDGNEGGDSSPLVPIGIAVLLGGIVAGGAWLVSRRLSGRA